MDPVEARQKTLRDYGRVYERHRPDKTDILLIGVGYSANLGDQAIRMAIEESLSEHQLRVGYLDIGGRHAPHDGNIVDASAASRIRSRLISGAAPGSVWIQRALLVPLMLGRVARNLAGWWKVIRHTDQIVIGGGNLFADEWLNFPLKIFILSAMIRTAAVPTLIYSVGSSPPPSRLGATILSRCLLLTRPIYTSARDLQTVEVLRQLGAANVELAPDPACLARIFGDTSRRRATDPIAVVETTAPAFQSISIGVQDAEYERRLIATINSLSETYRVILTATGESLDAAYARELVLKLKSSNLELNLPRSPGELCELLSLATVVSGSRLHFYIFATAMGAGLLQPISTSRKLQEYLGQLSREFTDLEDDAMHGPPPGVVWTPGQQSMDALEARSRAGMEGLLRALGLR